MNLLKKVSQKKKMKTAFVTGGAGFIGSHLSELLLDEGWKVKILVREGKMPKEYSDTVYPEVIEMLKKKGAEIFYGDLRDLSSFKENIGKIDTMFHVAGIAYPYFGLSDKVYFDVNTEATKKLANFCSEIEVGRFVYFSSIEAAGPSLDGKPLVEGSSRHPTDAYGESKKASEDFLKELSKKSKMEISIVRPPMTYGERSPLLARLFQFIDKGFFPMFGKGNALFEFCYVKNLVYGVYMVGIGKKSIGETYFVSEGSYKIIDVIKNIARVMDKKIKIFYIPKPPAYMLGYFMELLNRVFPFYPFRGKETGSPYFSRKTVDWVTNDMYICSIDKLKELGYEPPYSQEEGIRRSVAWYRGKGYI